MPDKPPTPWTADAAFWNDAWQDMDQRLQQRRRRRSPLPWLFLVLLLAGLIGAGTQVQWSSPTTTLATPPTERRVTTIPEKKPTGKRQAHTIRTTETRGRVMLTDPAPAPPAPLDVAPSDPPEVPALVLLPTLLPELLAVGFNLPQPVVVRDSPAIDKPVRIIVALGASTYTHSRQLGGFAEVDYLLGRGHWRFPVALRYDYGAREVRTDPPTPQEIDDLLFFTGGLSQVDEANASKTLYTHELSLRTGVLRAVGPGARLTVGGGVGLRYTLAGEGPVVSRLPGGDAFERAGLTGSINFSSADPLANGFIPYLDPRIHRWGLDGWLQLRYRFGGNWSILLGATHGLTPLYQEGRLDVDRTRVELGLSKGF